MRYFFFYIFLISLASVRAQDNQAIVDTTFIDIKMLSSEVILDMKYATADNFLKVAVYDCEACYLRKIAAEALVAANKDVAQKGYRIKLFDCYRPLDIQKKMWKIVPNPDYVADPAKGSLHNRGLAVDLTLIDENGNELDMGTNFDHFGPESEFAYRNISKEARRNRKLLNKIMERHGFKVLKSEWWHYNYQMPQKAAVSNFKWECDQGNMQDK
ncbi:D-alanyl-D-alanine dipeptidase [Flavobacterium silvaticum]|uniref:D-alanyl-D-alanine dipeptidase n=1 Tax=Flavobacterium silvaticum TaxID=1852020 RepID=UPI00293BBCDE|nr:D-alanyl-D-alanine dipeptidase [Flavobacterium silvaticum]